MAASEKELELELTEAGDRLLEIPSSVDELIPLLDQVYNCLSKVEQSPRLSMQNALSPSIEALVMENLFRHPDDDVKVAVAACISEITRITAPDAPYDDDRMRDVFKLIVSSFKNLSDKSSRSFIKRASTLETVAKVRSCVVMLDLECDALIVEMFQHFLKAINYCLLATVYLDYHAEAVFTSMLAIMTLVLEESEDVSIELLSPILASVKKDNEEVLPVARRLAEKVLENCALKLQPYLIQAVENLGISFDDYSSVVASICRVTAGSMELNDAAAGKHVDKEGMPAETPSEKAAQEDKETPKAAVSTEQVDLANKKSSSEPIVCNAIMQTTEDDSLANSNSVKKLEDDHIADKSKNDTSTVAEPDISKVEKVVSSDPKLEQSTWKKERKSDSKLTEPSDSSHADEKEVETLRDHKNDSKDGTCSLHEDLSVGGAVSSENKRATNVQLSSSKPTNVASPTPSGTVVDDSHSKRAARSKRKESVSKETTSSVDDVSKKAYEEKSDSGAKTNRRSEKKVAALVSKEDNAPVDADETKKESDTASDSETKSLKKSSKKVVSSNNDVDESSPRQLENKKSRARGKVVPEKDGTKNPTKSDGDEVVGSPKSAKPNKEDRHMEETPKTNSKRKHTPSKEKASNSKSYDENLIGLKVKVWWPKDREFYEGVIHSFDPCKKKHEVHYKDGDTETLNLKREKWAVIEDESGSDEEGAANNPSPDGSTDMPQKKKSKTADLSGKKAKMDASPKSGGGTLSEISKGAVTKSGRKTNEDAKADGKSKDGCKSVGKSDNDSVAKFKDHTPKTGSKSVDTFSKVGNKSKNEDSGDKRKSTKSKDDGSAKPKASTKLKQDTSKTAAKSKQETPKNPSHSKGKPLKSHGKSNVNGTGKSKSGSSKMKESETMKDNSIDSAKEAGSTKRKAPSSSKARGSDSKAGKKGQR